MWTLFFSLKHLVIRVRFGDLGLKQLGSCFFPFVLPCNLFEKMYSGCCRKRTKFQRRWEVTIRCVFGKYTVQRQIHTSFLRTGFGDIRTYGRLRSKRTIFDKVREISILLFVKFFTAFVNLSPKKCYTSHAQRGHVV